MDGGGDGEGESGRDVGTGKAEWEAEGGRKTDFTAKILHLMKVIGVLRFPVDPERHLSARAREALVEGSEIPCHESVCAECGRDYGVTQKQEGIAVRQASYYAPCRDQDWAVFVLRSNILSIVFVVSARKEVQGQSTLNKHGICFR